MKIRLALSLAAFLMLILMGGFSIHGARTASAQEVQPCPTTPEEAVEVFGALPRHWDRILGVPEGNCGWALLAGGEPAVNVFVPEGYIYLEQNGIDWPPDRWAGPLWIWTHYGEIWLGEKPMPNLEVETSSKVAHVGSPFTLTFSVDWSDEIRVYSNPIWDLPVGEYTSNNCARIKSDENSMWSCPVGVTNTLTIIPREERPLDLEIYVISDYYNGVVAGREIKVPVLSKIIQQFETYLPIVGR